MASSTANTVMVATDAHADRSDDQSGQRHIAAQAADGQLEVVAAHLCA
ncbi:MAG: hypothetical protein WDM77_17895 [Steroidobacteraceae bacterium]